MVFDDATRTIVNKKTALGQDGGLNTKYLIKALYDNTNKVRVVKGNGQPGGIAAYEIQSIDCRPVGCIYVCIVQAVQAVGGRGFGTELMQEIEKDTLKEMKDGDSGFMLLNALSRVIGFYEKLGLRMVDEEDQQMLLKMYSKLEGGDCVMQKILSKCSP